MILSGQVAIFTHLLNTTNLMFIYQEGCLQYILVYRLQYIARVCLFGYWTISAICWNGMYQFVLVYWHTVCWCIPMFWRGRKREWRGRDGGGTEEKEGKRKKEEEESRGGEEVQQQHHSGEEAMARAVASYVRRGLANMSPNGLGPITFLRFYWFNWTARNGGGPLIGPCPD